MLPANLITTTQIEQEYTVVKANSLIRKAHFSLSTQEQKLILYLISKIRPDDDNFKEYEFDLKNICRVCNIEYNGKNYQNLKDSLKSLHDKSFWIKLNKSEILCTWLQKAVIFDSTKIKIRLDETLKPFLLNLKDNYTKYSLDNILSMNSKYSIRLFELLQSYSYLGQLKITIQDLKALLQIDKNKYTDYKNFRVRVIDSALSEINKFTYLNVTYKTERQGRSIYAIIFIIDKKADILDRLAADSEKAKVLNYSINQD